MIKAISFIVSAFLIFGWWTVYQTGNYIPWGNIAITITIMNFFGYTICCVGRMADLNRLGDDQPFSVAKIDLAKKTVAEKLFRSKILLQMLVELVIAGLLSANGYIKSAAVYALLAMLTGATRSLARTQSEKILREKPEGTS